MPEIWAGFEWKSYFGVVGTEAWDTLWAMHIIFLRECLLALSVCISLCIVLLFYFRVLVGRVFSPKEYLKLLS